MRYAADHPAFQRLHDRITAEAAAIHARMMAAGKRTQGKTKLTDTQIELVANGYATAHMKRQRRYYGLNSKYLPH